MSNAADTAADMLSEASLSMLSKATQGQFSPSMSIAAGLMMLAFLSHLILELSKVRRGESPDYAKAIFVLTIHIALLTQYGEFSQALLTIGARLTKGGQIDSDAVISSAAKTLTARFKKHQIDTETDAAVTKLQETPATAGDIVMALPKVAMAIREGKQQQFMKWLEDHEMPKVAEAFQVAKDIEDTLPGPSTLMDSSPSQLIDKAMNALAQILVSFAFVLTSGVVLLLSMIQKTAIMLVIAVGPVIITLSAFPGPTSGLLFSWALTLLELQLWAFATTVLGSMMGTRFGMIPKDIASSGSVAANLSQYAENIAYCFILSGAYLTIPVLCGALLRGGGMGSVAGQMMGQATGFASGVVSGRLAGATPGGGGGNGGGGNGGDGGGGDGGGGDGASAGRAGDDGAAAPAPPKPPKTQGQHIAAGRFFKNKKSERSE